MSSLKELREKLQAKLHKTCVAIVANGRTMFTIKECCKSLKEHMKVKGDVDYYVFFDVNMYDQLSSMGVEENNKLVISDIPLIRIPTQCPPMFASRSTYWNMLALIHKFKEYDQGMMISSKIGIGIDITDDMISNNNSFTIMNDICITCTKDYTTGQYMKCCNENSMAYEYSEDDLPTYNSVIWGGNLVNMCEKINAMIESDLTTDILLANPSYYFNKYLWNNKPTKVFKVEQDFKNDLSMCIEHYKSEFDKIDAQMKEYEKEHPDKVVQDRNVNNPMLENLPPIYLKRIHYEENTPFKVLNLEHEYHAIIVSGCQRQSVFFVDKLPEQVAEPVEKTEVTEKPVENVAEKTEPVEKVAEQVAEN